MKRVLLSLCLLLCIAMPALAGQKAEILETYPAGKDVQLGTSELYYVRVAYQLDEPSRVWVRPYFQGKPANAGSNPAMQVSGSGETLGTFFLFKPGDQVDEIRVTIGIGSPSDLFMQSLPVRVVAIAGSGDGASPPAWARELKAQQEAMRKQAIQDYVNKPPTTSEKVFPFVFALAVLGLGLAGFILPIWAMRRWQGLWRMAAALPLAALVLTILNIAIGVMLDPTSHNLFPFEILFVSALGTGALFVMFVVRKLFGVGK